MDWLPLIIVVAASLGCIPAAIASKKGQSFFLWWLYGTLLFIAALPHALSLSIDEEAMDDRAVATGGRRKCPYCAELIRVDAIICRYCGRDSGLKSSLNNDRALDALINSYSKESSPNKDRSPNDRALDALIDSYSKDRKE